MSTSLSVFDPHPDVNREVQVAVRYFRGFGKVPATGIQMCVDLKYLLQVLPLQAIVEGEEPGRETVRERLDLWMKNGAVDWRYAPSVIW